MFTALAALTALTILLQAVLAGQFVDRTGRGGWINAQAINADVVCVNDVAAAVERAVLDTNLRGHVIEVGGPRNLTLNQLAALLQRATGRSTKVRHIPRSVLRAAAPFSRRGRAALAMDTSDMTFTPPRPHPNDQPLTDPIQALTRQAPLTTMRGHPDSAVRELDTYSSRGERLR
jgi:uncharacterized protein YbjT (DUF2867 family)